MEKSKNLISLEALNPKEVFTDEGVIKLIAEAKSKAVPKLQPDTPEGREELRSLAYEIARTKTGIDALRKDYVAELKSITSTIDKHGRIIWNELESLQESVRKPLTEFENAEKLRIQNHKNGLAAFRESVNFDYEPTSEQITERIASVKKLSERDFEEFTEQAKTLSETSIGRLGEKLNATIKAEQDAKELAELKAADEARKQAERDQAIREEAAKAEREKIAKELAESNLKAEPVNTASNYIAGCAEPIQQTLTDESKKSVAPELGGEFCLIEFKRQTNRAIVAQLMDECMLSETASISIVKAIAGGKIKNVSINYERESL